MAKIMCPCCGKRNTVPIVYGYPGVDLFEAQERGELRLGGCCVREHMAKRFCNDCLEEFDCNRIAFALTSELTFSIGGYDGECHSVEIRLKNDRWIAQYRYSSNGFGCAETDEPEAEVRKILEVEEWERFCLQLQKCYVDDWKKEYNDNDILDGTSWFLEIKTVVNDICSVSGMNAYPPYFTKFLKCLSELVGKKIE